MRDTSWSPHDLTHQPASFAVRPRPKSPHDSILFFRLNLAQGWFISNSTQAYRHTYNSARQTVCIDGGLSKGNKTPSGAKTMLNRSDHSADSRQLPS